MSGWYYMKEGMIEDSEKGPLTDATFLKMAFDGALNLKSKVRHEKHTGNQWAYLEQIQAAKKRIEDGGNDRAQKAAAEKATKEDRKRQDAVAREEEKLRRAEENAVPATRAAHVELIASQSSVNSSKMKIVKILRFISSLMLLIGSIWFIWLVSNKHDYENGRIIAIQVPVSFVCALAGLIFYAASDIVADLLKKE